MKRLLPTVLMIAVMLVFYKMASAGSISPKMMFLLPIALLGILMLTRPKSKGDDFNSDAISKILGDYAKDAFSDDSKLSKDFQAVVTNLQGNMPKAALAKLEKLAPNCRNDAERYAVAVLTGMVCAKLNEYKMAIVEYNRAIILNPTSDVAMKIGTCHQRLGQLKKARDSYEFAIELDPSNIPAMSALATAWVADGQYNDALDYAEEVLKLDETNASALATCAICHGLLNHPHRSAEYTEKAVAAGYSEKKIEDTIKALKK
jgi:tetratricopeptide (TPR) repeat protein